MVLAGDAAAAVTGADWEPVPHGADRVWRLRWDDGRADRFVKLAAGPPPRRADLIAEGERTAWVRDRAVDAGLPVARVIAADPGDPTDDTRPAALVTEALEGVPELAWLFDGPAAVRLLGETLRRVHDLPIADCPFDAGPAALIARARARLASGLVDPGGFPLSFRGDDPAALLDKVAAMAPNEPTGDDRVLVHGHWTVTNLLFEPASAACTGVLAWSRSGVGDRHLDLGMATQTVLQHFGPDVVPLLFEAYGLDQPELLRLDFYPLLDQFG